MTKKTVFSIIKDKKNILLSILSLLGVFLLYSPMIYVHPRDGYLIFYMYPYLLLPILLLFGLGIYFSDFILLRLCNIALFLYVGFRFIMCFLYSIS